MPSIDIDLKIDPIIKSNIKNTILLDQIKEG